MTGGAPPLLFVEVTVEEPSQQGEVSEECRRRLRTTDYIGPDGTWPMPSASGPCRTWPVESGCGCLPPDATTWDDLQIHSVEAATEILWRLTGGRFGVCREIVRPCRRDCWPGDAPMVIPSDGAWVDAVCGCRERSDRCSCGNGPSEISLPGPVYWEDPRNAPDIPEDQRYTLEVWIDGEKLTGGRYYLMDGTRLIRTDGEQWPRCQQLDVPYTAPGAFSIVYWRGTPVPVGGRRAVAILACELWRQCRGDASCRIPSRVSEVNREGVTYTMVDPQEFLSQGRTGVTEVDMWVSAVNPYRAYSPSTVLSPDQQRHRSDWYGGGKTPGQRRN